MRPGPSSLTFFRCVRDPILIAVREAADTVAAISCCITFDNFTP